MKSKFKKSKIQTTDQNTLKIPLLSPYFDSEELKEIRKVLDSGWVSKGPKAKEFENKIAKIILFISKAYLDTLTSCPFSFE